MIRSKATAAMARNCFHQISLSLIS